MMVFGFICKVVATAFNLDEEDQQTFKLKLQMEQVNGKKKAGKRH